jgi:uncharacterized protein (DUF983 family)
MGTRMREQTLEKPAAAACPFCGSTRLAEASAKPDASTYSRCETCGGVWNVARLGDARQPYGGR